MSGQAEFDLAVASMDRAEAKHGGLTLMDRRMADIRRAVALEGKRRAIRKAHMAELARLEARPNGGRKEA